MAFDPPLPPRKLQAVERLGFGTLNKVLLVFDHPFWEKREGKRDFWGVTARSARQRGVAFQFWNMQRCTGRLGLGLGLGLGSGLGLGLGLGLGSRVIQSTLFV